MIPYQCYQQYPCEITAKPDDPLGFIQRRDYAFESISVKQCMCLEIIFEVKVRLSSITNFVITVLFNFHIKVCNTGKK